MGLAESFLSVSEVKDDKWEFRFDIKSCHIHKAGSYCTKININPGKVWYSDLESLQGLYLWNFIYNIEFLTSLQLWEAKVTFPDLTIWTLEIPTSTLLRQAFLADKSIYANKKVTFEWR